MNFIVFKKINNVIKCINDKKSIDNYLYFFKNFPSVNFNKKNEISQDFLNIQVGYSDLQHEIDSGRFVYHISNHYRIYGNFYRCFN